jgi:CHAT domain-containing protein
MLLVLWTTSSALEQTAAPPKDKPTIPVLIKLTGEDEKRAKELDKQIDDAMKADRWDEAIAKTEDLLALRVKVQGPKHFETVDVEWQLKLLRRVARAPKEERAALLSAKTMYAQAEAFRAQGKFAAAQPLYEKALAIRRRLLTDDHPDTAAGYDGVALNLNAQGKYAAAQPLYEKALEIRRRLLTDDHTATALSYNNVAYNLNAQGKYAAAQPLFEKALEIRRRLLGVNDTDTAAGYNNLAFNLYAQGKYAAAQPFFEKALEINRRLFTDDHPAVTLGYNNVASNLNAQGNYAAAQPLFEKALEIRRRLLTDDHPYTAYGYNNLAFNLNAQGKYAAAQPLLEKALDIFRRTLTDDHPSTATSYNSVAYNLEAQGKYAAAQPLYEKALEICRRLLTDDHPDTARGYGSVAANLSAQGKYAAAQPLFEKALEIRRRLLGEDHPYTASSYDNLASNLQAEGKYAAAQPLFEKALEICGRVLADDHPDTAGVYNRVAYNLSAQGKYREAKDRWISAVKILDAARLRIAFTGLERAEKGNRARPALAAVLARLGQPDAAWRHLEEDLGRGLLDELTARADRRLAPGDRSRLRELTAELERLDRLVESTPRGLDQAERAKRFEELKRQRVLASIALGEFQTKLVHEHGPLAGEAAQLKEIQAALPADAAVVAWVDLAPVSPNAADPNGEHWGVVVRSRGVPAWITMAGTGPDGLWTQEDTGLANQVRTALRNRASAGAADLRPVVERLRTQRLGPLAQALGAGANSLPTARRLIVLSSRAMTGIPIEVLLATSDTRTVSYAPSATVFQYLRQQPRPDRRAGLLAVGDPVFERKLDRGLTAARSGDEDFAALPGTRYEVETLTQLFNSADRPTRTLVGPDASEPELDRLAASGELARFGFIHLATHGVIDEGVPTRSAVILTQTGLPDPLEQALNHKPVFDGRLSVREIQRAWDLKAELVTLSACETALGRESGGECFVGFTQALLMSGARSVCLSLWKVDDKATSLLMTRFYQNMLGKRAGLSKPMPKAEALQEAKRWLRDLTAVQTEGELAAHERGEMRRLARETGAPARKEAPASKSSTIKPFEHPYFWAAFVLVGDPD